MIDDAVHIVFSGGASGGHLFPGLAVAEQLAGQLPAVRITFAGSGKRLERRHVAAGGYDYLALPCRPLPKAAREAFSFLLHNLAGYLVARRLLAEGDVSVVVGLGGFASVPMARAAATCGVPLVLLEQNAVPGRATRWLARSAALICAALPPTRSNLRCRCPVYVTGTPIRSGFNGFNGFNKEQDRRSPGGRFETDRRCARQAGRAVASPAPRQLVVLGGSGGAQSLNENVPRALYKLRGKLAGWRIVHQSGEAGLPATRRLYGKLGLTASVVPFIDDVAAVLTASDLAVCRAGGTTLAELAAVGLPAVLLPYPHAADDHQRKNADVFSAAGGAVTLDHRELSGRLDDHLTGVLSGLLSNDAGKRTQMAAAMRRLARPGAAAEVAALIREVVRPRSRAATPAAA